MEIRLCHAEKEKELRLLLACLCFRFTKIEEEEDDDNYGVLIMPAERSWKALAMDCRDYFVISRQDNVHW
jgi:hypothetical protein